ncbi:15744_t:CDS:2, partial [Acaulospora colombiana]
ATESEIPGVPTLDIELVQKYCLLKVDENGEFVEKPPFEEYIDREVVQIFYTFSGDPCSIFVNLSSTVLELRRKIQRKLDIEESVLSLSFMCRPLEDHRTLRSYDIEQHSTIHVTHRLLGGFVGYYVITKGILNPKYDYDYINGYDHGWHRRGKERYHLPIGWEKIAFNVEKYGDNAANDISGDGYDKSKGKRFKFGKGIYSSPYYTYAERFAKEFQYENQTYKVMLQNRVNPADLQKKNEDQEWITENEDNIRP